MAHTKRSNKRFGEVLRNTRPYKRQQRKEILKEFEVTYIEQNKSPLIEL